MTGPNDQSISEMAAKYRQRLELDAKRKRDGIEDKRLLAADAPQLWTRLTLLMEGKVRAINKLIESEALSWEREETGYWEITRVHDRAKLSGTYDPGAFEARFNCSQAKIDLTLYVVVRAGEVQFVSGDPRSSEAVNPAEDLAHGLLEDFLAR